MVEDDPEVAAAYRLRLQLDGFPVEVANSGAAALALAMRSRWDLVLLDVGLPGASAFDVLASLRSDPRTSEVPVVILANRHDAELFERARGLGAIDYLIRTHTTPAQVSLSVPHWVAAHRARPASLPQGVPAHGATAMANGS